MTNLLYSPMQLAKRALEHEVTTAIGLCVAGELTTDMHVVIAERALTLIGQCQIAKVKGTPTGANILDVQIHLESGACTTVTFILPRITTKLAMELQADVPMRTEVLSWL